MLARGTILNTLTLRARRPFGYQHSKPDSWVSLWTQCSSASSCLRRSVKTSWPTASSTATKSPTDSYAQLAGKIIAAAPAVRLGPLFARAVYKAMTGRASWDKIYPSEQAALADIECYLQTMAATAGANCWKQDKVLLVAGDASEDAYAAYTPNGESQQPVVVTCNAEELALMAANEYSAPCEKSYACCG